MRFCFAEWTEDHLAENKHLCRKLMFSNADHSHLLDIRLQTKLSHLGLGKTTRHRGEAQQVIV